MRIVASARIALALLLAAPGLAGAQGIANSLHELRLLVRAGDTVTVQDTGGREVKGRIDALSASRLVLVTSSGRREWEDADLRVIRQRRGDSLGNGALIGLGVGAGLGLAGGLALQEESDEAGLVATIMLVYGGLGAAIGVGVDALVTRQYVIYERPDAARPQVRVTPLLTPRAQGLRVTLSF
jgi:hypothetical protein